jgi:hypothetical protein
MGVIKGIASLLIIIGSINWGLVGLFDYDIIERLFKSKNNIYARISYTLIGLAGVFTLIYVFLT